MRSPLSPLSKSEEKNSSIKTFSLIPIAIFLFIVSLKKWD
jgi:hypothetical protein